MSYDNFSRFYDSLTGNVEYEKRADYYEKLLSSVSGEKGILLDLGCGTGSMSIQMAKKGYEVIGIDSSVGMLNAAREKIYEAGADVLLLNQSMEELDLFGTVDHTISVLDSINHLPGKNAVIEAFKKVSLFTVPGGAFAFDVNTVYKHRNVLADNAFVFENDDVFCTWQNNLNEDDSVDIELNFFEEEDGAYYRESEYFTEQAYSLEEISSMLDKAGFDVVRIYDDMTFEPVREDSERAVFLAKKR